MDIKRQLGQLFIIGFQGPSIPPGSTLEFELKQNSPGGVILFDRCLTDTSQPANIVSPEQLRFLVERLKDLSKQPLLVCIDQEGGMVRRLKPEYGFPETVSAKEMGERDSIEFTVCQAEKTAKTLNRSGINVNFAPVVDLDKNTSNPIIGKVKRSFSAETDTVIRHAKIWLTTHRANNVISCLKHFPGHGSSDRDSHLGFVDISTTWDNSELLPYRKLLDCKLIEMIMVGHLYNDRIDRRFPATLSRPTVTGILREKLGYQGVIVTDDMQMKAITAHYGFGQAIILALAAGIDMIVIGNNLEYRANILEQAIDAVAEGLDQGLLAESDIATSLARIKKLKRSLQD